MAAKLTQNNQGKVHLTRSPLPSAARMEVRREKRWRLPPLSAPVSQPEMKPAGNSVPRGHHGCFTFAFADRRLSLADGGNRRRRRPRDIGRHSLPTTYDGQAGRPKNHPMVVHYHQSEERKTDKG